MQMMSRDNVLDAFAPDDFSVICLDEAHHSGADSYRKIMEYFRPGFWLGMTASPETDLLMSMGYLTTILPIRFDYSRH